MNKYVSVALIVAAVVVAYMLITVLQPITVSMVESANTTISASSNLSNYPGTQAALIGWPWWLWFVPAFLGTILVVVELKRQ